MIKLIKIKDDDKFYATGDTYEHRNELRRAGWIWEPAVKAWSTRRAEPIEKTLDIFTHIKSGTSKALFRLFDIYIAPRGDAEKPASEKPVEVKKETPSVAVTQMWEGLLEKPATTDETQFVSIDKTQSGINPYCWIAGIEIINFTADEGETSFGYSFHYATKNGKAFDDMPISGYDSPGAAKAKAFERIESARKQAEAISREEQIQESSVGPTVPVTNFSLKGLGY